MGTDLRKVDPWPVLCGTSNNIQPFFATYKEKLPKKKLKIKTYKPCNETCKKFANSDACFSISFKLKGSPTPVKGISRFPFKHK